MITASDAENIIYGLVKPQFGLPVYHGWNNSNEDRIVLVSHPQTKEKQWMKNFIDVCLVVPDVDNEAQRSKLNEYQRLLHDFFYINIVGEKEGTGYEIDMKSIGIEEDSQLKSHYVNCKLLISALR